MAALGDKAIELATIIQQVEQAQLARQAAQQTELDWLTQLDAKYTELKNLIDSTRPASAQQ